MDQPGGEIVIIVFVVFLVFIIILILLWCCKSDPTVTRGENRKRLGQADTGSNDTVARLQTQTQNHRFLLATPPQNSNRFEDDEEGGFVIIPERRQGQLPILFLLHFVKVGEKLIGKSDEEVIIQLAHFRACRVYPKGSTEGKEKFFTNRAHKFIHRQIYSQFLKTFFSSSYHFHLLAHTGLKISTNYI